MLCKVCKKDLGFRNDFPKIKDKYSYITCLNCSAGILDPFPKPEIFQEKFETEDYYDNLSAKANNKFYDWFLNLRIYEMFWEFVLRLDLDKGKILDVGCGNGEYLYELKKEGFDVYATDYSKIALSRTQKRTSAPQKNFYQGDFSEINFEERFKIVSFWHVLEHVGDPSSYLQKAYSVLENEGIVVGEVPNYNSLVLAIFKKKYNWLMIPEHIIYFTPKSLELILEEAGFKNIVIFNPNRSVINFSSSISNFLSYLEINSGLVKVIYFSSLILTIPLMILFSIINRGEVLRFYAKK